MNLPPATQLKLTALRLRYRVSWPFVLAGLVLAGLTLPGLASADTRPNILWITSEDNGPHLGCYGDDYADTPHLDGLAARGVIYLNCWSNAPVCAPARTTLISGIYPPSTGAEHMRSVTRLPAAFKMYPQYLREAGYYCTNNNKEDYNLEKPGKVWDESSRQAHWRNRKPGQPFFAIFNFTTTHESQIRKRPHTAVHDPATVKIPAYHPDRPEVRQDWAQYHDKMTEMDAQAGRVLEQLNEDGLAEDTIVFYYGDHGPGMPRGKRWPYNSGLQVPLIVHIPAKFQHLASPDYSTGGQSDRLVGFIDLAPTLLSLAGLEPPEHFQGHAFLGEHRTDEQPFHYGFRGRMDERYDMLRVVRDKRYVYIRNYMPHKIYGQFISYMFQTPTTKVWKQLYDSGELTQEQSYFWERKPPEELYDLQEDPDEVHNLIASPAHRGILDRLRAAQRDWALRIRDVGFLPEDEVHTRSGESTPYEVGHDNSYPLEELIAVADTAASLSEDGVPMLTKALKHDDSAVRYWGAMGLLMRGEAAVAQTREELLTALKDSSPSVRVIAAQAIGQYGADADLTAALDVLLQTAHWGQNSLYISMLSLNALDALDQRAAKVKSQIAQLPRKGEGDRRLSAYVGNLIDKTLSDFE